MKTVQMTLDDELVREIDRVVKQLGTTRSAFAREALRAARARVRRRELERKHRAGYARQPVEPGEFSDWEAEHTSLSLEQMDRLHQALLFALGFAD